MAMMVPKSHPFAPIFEQDERFSPAAYFFVFEALTYAQERLGLGSDEEGEERHVTGQELCMAIREFTEEQFGFMGKCVLNHWGIHSTSDFGEIVYNLIRIGRMKKTPNDSPEHFADVFDFEKDLQQCYRINLPK